jgi:ribosomal protein S18 acetylase RimI-like enzyme
MDVMDRSVDRAEGTLELPDAPAILGLTFRHYRGPADHPAMAAVANAQNRADEDPEVVTVAAYDVEYANLTNSDPYRDVIVAQVGGSMIGYARAWWEDQNDGSRAYLTLGWLDPAWRRRGIGGAMLRHQLRRLQEIGRSHPDDRPHWYGSWCSDANAGAMAMFRDAGFRVDRRFFLMVRPDLEDLVVPPMPQGLELRPVPPDRYRQVFLADNEAFRDHYGGVDPSEEALRRWVGHPTFDPRLFLVAWDGDEVAGAVLNLIDHEENQANGYRRGWLDSVFTRRPWRRRGLAAALIGRSLVLLRERGMTSAQLGVDAENPNQALRLYQDAGFRVDRSATAWRLDPDDLRG